MLKSVFSRFTGSGFAQNALLLTGGTVIAQLIPILLQPFLRRIFSTTEYGVYSIYLSVVGILTIVATFRYDNAIVLPKSDLKASNVLALSVLINLVLCIILLLIAVIAQDPLSGFLKLPEGYEYVLYLIPAGVFLFCLQQTLNFWLIRKSAFAESAGNKVIRRAIEGGVHTVTGIRKIQPGLIIGDLCGGFASCLAVMYRMSRKDFQFRLVSKKVLQYVAFRYADFPKFNLLPTLLSAIAFQMPLLLINRYFETRNVAEFDLARQMLNVPLALVAITFSQVLLQNLSVKKQQNLSVRKLLSQVLYVLLAIVAVEILIIKIWGPDLFGFVFGDTWAASGQISKILVYNFALNFIMSSFTAVFIAFNKLKLYSIWQVMYFLSMLTLVFFEPLPYRLFVLSYVIIDSILILAGIALIVKVIHNYETVLRRNSAAY